jgi:ParB-like chromosome segregation protein Spo0J
MNIPANPKTNGKPRATRAKSKPAPVAEHLEERPEDKWALRNAKQAEIVDLASLKPHPRNYREHPDDQIEHIIASIKENGFYRNIILAKDGTILAGHGVVKASLKMGLRKSPAYRLPLEPDEPQALKILAGDNETGRLAVSDGKQLVELLKGINDIDTASLVGTGYNPMQLDELIASLEVKVSSKADGKEYDESAADTVEYLTCPACQHKWPK